MNEIQLVQNFWTIPDFLCESNITGPEFLDLPRFSVLMKYNWSRISGPAQIFRINEIQLVQNFWTSPE
jgi:hypothetical protein